MGKGNAIYSGQEKRVCHSQPFLQGPKQYKKVFQGRNGLKINTEGDRKKET